MSCYDEVDSDICSTTSDTTSSSSCNSLSQRDLRGLIFNLLYAAESFDYAESLSSLIDNFNRGFELDIAPDNRAVTIAQAVIDAREDLDIVIKPLLHNWRPERIGVCTKLILRLAIWELGQKETPPSIVINEAIELAKCYAEKDAYKFINGVLDEALKTVFVDTTTAPDETHP